MNQILWTATIFFSLTIAPNVFSAAASQSDDPEVQAGSLSSVSFRAVDEGGNPLSNVIVSIEMATHSGNRFFPKALPTNENGLTKSENGNLFLMAKTNAQGETQADPSDFVCVLFQCKEKTLNAIWSYDADVDKLPEDSEIIVKLLPAVSLRGEVIDADTQKPVAGCEVNFGAKLHARSIFISEKFPKVETNEAGEFEFNDLVAGIPGFVQASKAGYLTLRHLNEPIVPSDEAIEV